MTQRIHQWATLRLLPLAAATILFSACSDGGGGGGNNPNPTDTPVPTATAVPPTATSAPPTATLPPPASLVSGLVVLRNDVPTGAEDSLGLPPPEWMQSPDATEFDQALSHADWVLEGPEGRRGTTGPDGRFEIRDLPPGEYILIITKTLRGDLASVAVPIVVGSDGNASVVIEVDRGLVRSTSTYLDNGVTVSETSAPNGGRVVTRDGGITEFGDRSRTYTDTDGDGFFDGGQCDTHITLCPDTGECTQGRCQCSSSCPFCDDCPAEVCAPPSSPSPYSCNDDGSCEIPGDICVCVPSCDDCADCALQLCVPGCEPFEIESIEVTGPTQLRIGRQGQMRAIAVASNGGRHDVTYMATWTSSDNSIVSVDSWGTVVGKGLGSAEISATFAGIESSAAEVEVVERPALRRIQVEIGPCIYPIGAPEVDDATAPAPPEGDFFRDPSCRQIIRIGSSISLLAFGEYEDGSFEEITRDVEWQVDPSSIGNVVEGEFTGTAEGTASITATLGGVTSDPREIRVVEKATLVQLTIYAVSGPVPPIFFPIFEDDPVFADEPFPCFECGFGLTVLRGDEVHFTATARYDTGEWEDVTQRVTWRSSNTAAATIDTQGLLTAIEGGESTIDAVLDEVTSNPVDVNVVNEATLQYLYIYQDGLDRVVGKGGQAFFRANGTYDVGFGRDVTDEVTWHSSDETVGGFNQPGVFSGRAAGNIEVWAELDGIESERLPMAVFETSDIAYCDPDNVNRGIWSDAFNRVVLESDCAQYTPPDVVELRFTVTERERPGGIFDPCLDLYVYQDGRKIRTVREEGCGEPFLAPGAPEFEDEAPRFQLKAFWDLKDDRGNVVPPGRYTIHGRFYLYFDPVVRIDITVTAPNGRIPCIDNPCGNGCGYVHACGDDGPPLECPAVCKQLCECPQGWGITDDGDCEPCPMECCPLNSSCLPGVPLCEPATCGGIAGVTCPADEICDLRDPMCATSDLAGVCVPRQDACIEIFRPVCGCDGVTYDNDCFRVQAGATLSHEGPCSERCCPMGADCGPANLPPCEIECCPPNARCTPDIPPCEPDFCGGFGGFICPDGEVCDLRDPTCALADNAGACVPLPDACTRIYDPVCGCDGVTYGNDCERLRANATLAHPGECGEPRECCPAGQMCVPELPPCELECCPTGTQCEPGTPPCDPTQCCPEGQACIPELPPCELECCPLGALCGPLDLPPCVTGCCPTDPPLPCPAGLPPCEG